jgi:hypothetical protein
MYAKQKPILYYTSLHIHTNMFISVVLSILFKRKEKKEEFLISFSLELIKYFND